MMRNWKGRRGRGRGRCIRKIIKMRGRRGRKERRRGGGGVGEKDDEEEQKEEKD